MFSQLIYVPSIFFFLLDLSRVRTGTHVASYCSLWDFLRRTVFRGLWFQKRRFGQENNALAIDQLYDDSKSPSLARLPRGCWCAPESILTGLQNSFTLSDWFFHNKLVNQKGLNFTTFTALTSRQFYSRCNCARRLKTVIIFRFLRMATSSCAQGILVAD